MGPGAEGSRTMKATVVITTRNRKDDLMKAIESAVQQSARPEVLVIDDGSTDGTSEAVKRAFPRVWLERSESSSGLIRQRNYGALLANTPVLFSIDDDAVFSTKYVIEQTLRSFDHPRVGAVAIPFIDVNRGAEIRQLAPDVREVYAAYSYIGTAHALRRDLFNQLGGYRDILIHQGEEEDYCLRLLQAGYITRLGTADPIHHFESPRRSWARMDYYGARNKVLYAWQNVPFPFAAGHLGATTAMTLCQSFQPYRFWTRLRGVLSAYLLCLAGSAPRQAVPPAIYRLSRKLKQREATPLFEIEHLLKPSAADSAWMRQSLAGSQPT
jgi:glycosyltransferase involved in cell wall biosynthesis